MTESLEQRIHAHMRNTEWEFTTRFIGLGLGGKAYVRIRVRMDPTEDIETQLRSAIEEVQQIDGLAIGDYGNALPYLEYADSNPLNHGSSVADDVYAVIECRASALAPSDITVKKDAAELIFTDQRTQNDWTLDTDRSSLFDPLIQGDTKF